MQTLGKLSKLVGGDLLGDPSTKISSVSIIPNAEEGSIAFVLDSRNLKDAIASKASAIVAEKGSQIGKKPAILVSNPRLALAKILALFSSPCEIAIGIHKSAAVDKSAKIGKNTRIGAFVYVGPSAKIGDNSIIYPNVSIYGGAIIGKNCIIHSGVSIGMDGFGFVPFEGRFEKIPQIGKVVIEDNVEIYSNTCVARGTIGNTIIRKGTKIDNLTQVAHNCEIGENCAIVSFVGLSGSTKLGNNVSVGGQVGTSGHLSVGDNTVVMARSGITKNIPANSIVSGFPAQDHKKEMENQAALRRLPSLLKKLNKS